MPCCASAGGAEIADIAQTVNIAKYRTAVSPSILLAYLSVKADTAGLDDCRVDLLPHSRGCENVPGREEGLDPDDHHRLSEVIRAKEAIGESQNTSRRIDRDRAAESKTGARAASQMLTAAQAIWRSRHGRSGGGR